MDRLSWLSRWLTITLIIAIVFNELWGSTLRAQSLPVSVAGISTSAIAPMGLRVNTYSGTLHTTRTDLFIASDSLPIDLNMSYNSSRAELNLGFGFGWQFSYNLFYVQNEDGSIVVFMPDGSPLRFSQQGGAWVGSTGIRERLEALPAGGFLLTTANGNLRYYFESTEHKRVTRVLDRNDNSLSFVYDAENLLIRIEDGLGRRISLSYSSDKRLLFMRLDGEPERLIQFGYNPIGDLIRVIDPLGNITRYYYGDSHRMESITDARGNRASIDYDASLRVIAVRSALSRQTFSYDDANRTTSMSILGETVNQTIAYVYDSMGRIVAMRDGLGNTVAMSWDNNGNLLRFTDANGATSEYGYDGRGNLIRAVDPLGNITLTEYNEFGLPIRLQNPLGIVNCYEYDERGNLLNIIGDERTITTYQYDERGRVIAESDALGNTSRYSHNAFAYSNRAENPLGQAETYEYDPLGNLSQRSLANGETASYQLDLLGNPLEVNQLGMRIQNSYDANGNLLRLVDSTGAVYSYDYDALNRLIAVTEPNGASTHYRYDGAGNLIEIVDALGRVTRMEYDAIGRVISETNPLGQTLRFEYDAVGNIIGRTAPDGTTSRYHYNANGQLLETRYPDGTSVVLEYDALGRRISMSDSTGITRYSYDNHGNLLSITDPDNRVVAYSYDEANRVTAITYPDSSMVSYDYDAAGNMIAVSDSTGTTEYRYDVQGQVLERLLPTGVTSRYRYNAQGSPIALEHFAADGSPLLHVNYEINEFGLRTAITESDSGTSFYEYNALGQLSAVTYADGSHEAFSYDLVGNRLSHDTSAGTSQYRYNEANQLIELTAADGTVSTFSYDPQGNLIERQTGESTISYRYDSVDRLIEIQTVEALIQYIYDGDGVRVAQIVNGERSDFINSIGELDHVLGEYASDGSFTRYTLGHRERINLTRPDGTSLYYLEDAHKSIMGMIDNTGALVERYTYDAFGLPQAQASSGFRYTAQAFEAETGLIYLRARYYDPALGRYLSRDPHPGDSEIPLTMNGYSYAENNPVNFMDPSGEFFFIPFLIGFAIAAVKAAVVGATIGVAAGAVLGGIVTAANGGNFWEGAGQGALAALKDPLTYLPLPGLGQVATGVKVVARFAASAGISYAARAGLAAARAIGTTARASRAFILARTAGSAAAASVRLAFRAAIPATLREGGKFVALTFATKLALGTFKYIDFAPSSPFRRNAVINASGEFVQYYQNPDGTVNQYGLPLGAGQGGYTGVAGLFNVPDLCIAAPPSQIFLGDEVIFQETLIPVNVRQDPGNNAPIMGQVDTGTRARVLEGPVCGLGNGLFTWWLLEFPGTEFVGWVAEGDAFRQQAQYFIVPSALATANPVNPLNCPAAIPSLLEEGDVVMVNPRVNHINLRSSAGGEATGQITTDTEMTIIGGPACHEFGGNFLWWEVRSETGATGWIAEGDGTQYPPLYFVMPPALIAADEGRTPIDLGCGYSPRTILRLGDVAEAAQTLNLRTTPSGELLRTMDSGNQFEIVGGPVCDESRYSWWLVRTSRDEIGWIAEGDITQRPTRYFINIVADDDAEEGLGFDTETSACGSAPLPMLSIGDVAFVTDNIPTVSQSLNVSPYGYGEAFYLLDPGSFVYILDGPVCGEENTFFYYLVRSIDGQMGWLPEGNANLAEPYYLFEYVAD